MSDVAELAGVSHQTVSRVLKGSSQVRPATRDRVLEAIRVLDYRPNSAARTLATGRSRTLGVITFGATLYGPASALDAIESAAGSAGYSTIMVSAQGLDRRSVLEAVGRLREQNVEGIFVTVPQAGDRSPLIDVPGDVPIVAVEAAPDDRITAIGVDQRTGAARATRHLLDLGHATVQHVSGPRIWLAAQRRIDGWRSVLQDAGAAVPDPVFGDWSARSGYEIGRRIAARPEVTAIFAANDQMALGVLHALRESGRSVPEDVSVIGFDDIPEAQHFPPPLTTVRQDFREVARRGVQALLSRMEAPHELAASVLLAPDLVVRESTARYNGTETPGIGRTSVNARRRQR